jgi:hypothetical protein
MASWQMRGRCFGGVLTIWVPVLPNLTGSKLFFYRGMLILCQSHHVNWACTHGIATMSGGDGMDLALKYVLSCTRGLLWPCPIVPGVSGHLFPRP